MLSVERTEMTMARKLDYRCFEMSEEYVFAFEREWREWISQFPEVATLPIEERERFKMFARRIIDHINGIEF